MNAHTLARNAYSDVTAPIRSTRSIEYDLVARITHKLKAAILRPDDFPALAEALHNNNKMWTTFAADVSDDENALPQTLRAQLFYLAEFTLQHTSKVLAGDATANVLVEINASILTGLKAKDIAA